MPLSPSSTSDASTIVADKSPERLSFQPKVNLEHLFRLLNPVNLFNVFVELLYRIAQVFIILVFKPPPPTSSEQPKEPYGRIAVIGAGLTGISSAAHAIAHNFDVTIYEAKPKVGGIWADVNKTSGLQLNSMLYRFHPGVYWKHTFPHRDEILGEIRRIWTEYQLEPRTKFNTLVKKVTRAPMVSTKPEQYGHSRWMINETDGPYDAIIVNVGTCGEPALIDFEGAEQFAGKIVHSSQLDDVDLEGKEVVIVGSGASGVEAAELAVNKHAKGKVVMLARDDKWIIPRNIIFDTLISAQPFGREMPLSFIPEWFLKMFHYGNLKDLTPCDKGIFEGTPIVNNDFLKFVRQGKAEYIRGDTKSLTRNGVKVSRRERGTKPGDEGEEIVLHADIVVLATGFKRPSIDFLPKDLFPDRYQRPSLYLQNFSTEDWSILMTNSSYRNALGTVGHFHIGIYTRILLAFLLDKSSRPLPEDMKLWVDALRFLKRDAKGGALGFFTYMELTIWLATWHLWRPRRLKWLLFIMHGWGLYWSEGRKRKYHT